MKRSLSIFTILALAGCQSTGGVSPQFITNVQALTQTACAFIPTAEVIAQIYASGNADLTKAEAVAAAVCAAVKPSPAIASAPSGSLPSVAGVLVKGTFVGR